MASYRFLTSNMASYDVASNTCKALGPARRTCASSPPPSSPCRRPPRRTWSASSRTPTSAPSTPSASPSCPRTSSSPAASAASALKRLSKLLLKTRVAQHLPTQNLNGENFHHHFKRIQTETVLLSAPVKHEMPHPLAFLSLASPRPNTTLQQVRAPAFHGPTQCLAPRSCPPSARNVSLRKSPATAAALGEGTRSTWVDVHRDLLGSKSPGPSPSSQC